MASNESTRATTAPDLLPCPFCGEKCASVHAHPIANDAYMGMCANCTAEGPMVTSREAAAEEWNRRASREPAPVARDLPTKAEIDAIVYQCRQNGNDTTYDIVNAAIAADRAARGVARDLDVEAERRAYIKACPDSVWTVHVWTDRQEEEFKVWLAARRAAPAPVSGKPVRTEQAAGAPGAGEIPVHLLEFVQEIANEYTYYDPQESICCGGCGADLDDKQPHEPDCIVLRAKALLSPNSPVGADKEKPHG